MIFCPKSFFLLLFLIEERDRYLSDAFSHINNSILSRSYNYLEVSATVYHVLEL